MFRFIKHVVILVFCTALMLAGDAEEIRKFIEDDFQKLNDKDLAASRI